MKSLIVGVVAVMGGMIVVLVGFNDPTKQPRIGFISDATANGSAGLSSEKR
ncbi:hypothetical protein SAMN03159496_04475 [Rhizobium sp. NFR07]|uniref:hypothetical protein n=1 Tax=Rhizobium sp. NFR07 TaxID=1566262 RepID=UPI0008EF81E0|nr:hypothetical protein [Rhizobium sp. NFR07]SFB50911.1 hypothetical protein SAMN03159496_04475 [Rhizobium sp. NFR07]